MPCVDVERRRERRVLLTMCVLIAVNQLGFGALIPVLPLYARSFGVSATAIGLAVAVYGLARFGAGVPTGYLADRIGRRPTLALGGAVSALGNVWCAYAPGYAEFIAARFVAGAGATLVLTAGSIVLADISTPARRGRMMAIYQGTFLFAVGVGPLPGGLLAEHYGLAAPFHAYALLALLAGAWAWFAVAETRDFRSAAGRERAVLPPLREQLRLLMAGVGFRLVSAVGFSNALVRTGALFALVPLIGRDRIDLGATQIGMAMALGSVLGLLVSYPAGVLVDRVGRKVVIVPATVLSGVSMLLFCVAPSYGWFLFACLVWGAASAVGGAAPAAYAADCAPPGMNAAAMSSYRTLSDMGYVVGPIALGALADLYGAEQSVGLAAVALVLVGVAFARYAPETHRPGA